MKYCRRTITNYQISIAYDEINSIREIDHPQPHLVTKLVIIHSGLQSLEGIEEYTSLQVLNLKYNNLEVPDDIMRIPNKSELKQLNIQGNNIQHYSLCKYISLRGHGFTDLLLFNGQDYSKWGKNKRKAPSAAQMHAKIDKVERSMQKTLKRVVRNNVMHKYKLAADIEQQDEEATSRQSQKNPTPSMSSCERTPFRQISLSNANMIRSVKIEHEYPQQKVKGNQLVIEPIGFGQQNQIMRLPLTQPTATFASQRQRQAMPFRGRSHYISEIRVSEVQQGNYEEQDQNCEQDLQGISYIMTSNPRQTRRFNSNQNKSGLEDMVECAVDVQGDLAEGFYLNQLKSKAFRALKPNNMPRRVVYV